MNETDFMAQAINISIENVKTNDGGPFGAVIVKEGKIIATGRNLVIASNDPTAHAEMVAIRKACEVLNAFQLTGCKIYTSCEPCPMCLGAIYWARPDKVYYANTKKPAALIGFDDYFIYEEIAKSPAERQIPFIHLKHEKAIVAFEQWAAKSDKIEY